MADSLSSKIEELQRRWREPDFDPDFGLKNHRPFNIICADELTQLLQLANEMERALGKIPASQRDWKEHQKVCAYCADGIPGCNRGSQLRGASE